MTIPAIAARIDKMMIRTRTSNIQSNFITESPSLVYLLHNMSCYSLQRKRKPSSRRRTVGRRWELRLVPVTGEPIDKNQNGKEYSHHERKQYIEIRIALGAKPEFPCRARDAMQVVQHRGIPHGECEKERNDAENECGNTAKHEREFHDHLRVESGRI